MKLRITLMLVLGFGLALFARADDLPVKLSFDRYKGILEHSPFAVATAVVAPAATPNFAKDLYVANAAKSADGDMVTIASMTDKDFKKYLTTKTPVDGYGISSIVWSDKVGETKVTISKDGQYATLTFNQAEMSKPSPNKPGPPPMPVPSYQQAPSFSRPVGLPTPTPHVRGVIQRNPNAAPATPNSAAED
jgi:hypothetical protein